MTDLHRIAAARGGEVRGDSAFIPTPGHSPRDRGTSVTRSPGAPGGFLVHSFNGGDALAIKDGLRADRLIPDRERPERARDVAVWEYQDAAGVTRYRKVRMALPDGGKSYRLEHPDGRGGWAKGRGPAPAVPYRLPDLIAAPADAQLYLVEGEKQADKLHGWGLLATSLRDWRRDWSGYVAGRTVIILPDNDPAGAEQAGKAAKLVEAAGGRAITVTLPGLPAKGDVMDWAGMGGSAFELHRLVEAAMNPPGKMLRLLDPSAWAGVTPPSREWALRDWIPARQATYLTGAGSTGKSLTAQQLCTCIAAGRPFMGVETQQAVAIYVTCEDDADELHRRQAAICEALRIDSRELSGKLHLVSLAGAIGNELATFDPDGRMKLSEAYATLRNTVLAIGAGFIALDNVAHLFAGNENIRNQVAGFCSALNGLAADADAAVLFLGHPNKAGDSFSGSTAWENQVRSRLFLEVPRAPDGGVLDRDARVLSRGKANYAANGETLAFRWHQWAFVRDEDMGDDWTREMASAAAAGHDNALFLACLDERNRQQRGVSERASKTFAPIVFAAMPESKGIGKARLEAAMDRPFRLGEIERGLLPWRHDRKPVEGLQRCANARANPAPTGCANGREQYAPTRANTHSPYCVREGGADDGPPPSYPDPDPDDLDWGNGAGEDE